MFNKLKQFKELKDQAKHIQSKLALESAEVDSNWGKLKVKVDGNMNFTDLQIDDSLLEKSNKASLEKDIANLFNDGVKKIQKKIAQAMAKEGNLPNLGDLFKS